MNAALVPIFAGAVAAALTALVTWLLGRRKSSGTVATSEATDLWQAARTLQEALSAELVSARTEAVQLRTETVVLREEGAALRAEAAELREQMGDLKEELVKCNSALRQQRPRLRAKPA